MPKQAITCYDSSAKYKFYCFYTQVQVKLTKRFIPAFCSFSSATAVFGNRLTFLNKNLNIIDLFQGIND